MTNLKPYKNQVYQIIGSAMSIHAELGWGLLEAVYQEALQFELTERHIDCEREKEIQIYYKDHLLDKKYRMDIIAGDIIIELKSVTQISPAHRAQLCNYLRLTKKPLGVLINFGEEDLIGERWGYDIETNKCFLVDKNMDPVFDKDYSILFNTNETDENNLHQKKILMSD